MTIRIVANQQTYGDMLSKKGKQRVKLGDISFWKKSYCKNKEVLAFGKFSPKKND